MSWWERNVVEPEKLPPLLLMIAFIDRWRPMWSRLGDLIAEAPDPSGPG